MGRAQAREAKKYQITVGFKATDTDEATEPKSWLDGFLRILEMTENDAKTALLKLFQCFNASGGSDGEKKIKFAAYWEALADLPFGLIVVVCRRASRGEVGNRGFLPTAAELYHAAVKSLPRNIPHMIESPGRYISSEEREIVSTLMHNLANEMKMFRDRDKPQQPDNHNIDIEAYLTAKYRDKPLPPISAEMRAILGAGIPRIE